jgi:hypothetical protein
METRETINVRVKQGTRLWWRQEAAKNNFIYGNDGATGDFLDAIASGEYVVIPREVWEKIFPKSA